MAKPLKLYAKRKPHEDLVVSCNTAELLVKIGFNEQCDKCYGDDCAVIEDIGLMNNELDNGKLPAPSLNATKEWLENNYGISASCTTSSHRESGSYDIEAVVTRPGNLFSTVLEIVVSKRAMHGDYESCLSELLYECCFAVFERLKESFAKEAEQQRLVESYSTEWNSVEDRLPTDVLVDEDLSTKTSYSLILCSKRNNTTKMCIGHYMYESKLFYNSANACMFPATHWRLAPKPPRDETPKKKA